MSEELKRKNYSSFNFVSRGLFRMGTAVNTVSLSPRRCGHLHVYVLGARLAVTCAVTALIYFILASPFSNLPFSNRRRVSGLS
jgi:hypothetical protein